MLNSEEFPVIISPSLGCPQIITAKSGMLEINVIVAAVDQNFGNWKLVPSSSNRGDPHTQAAPPKEVTLKEAGKEEIPWKPPPVFSSVEQTKEHISREFFLNVLGGKATIYKVRLELNWSDDFLRRVNGRTRPTLYDLCMENPSPITKPHAICLNGKNKKELHVIHLTDLHLAKRNDLIKSCIENVTGPVADFNNFNENARTFINMANRLADKGELDLVLIGGDLVDFVNHGTSDKVNPADNNWHVFVEIFTGGGHEPLRENPNSGIRVPVFTSTGNHDWRYHPYDISVPESIAATFNLTRKAASDFDFNYYDSVAKIKKKQEEVCQKIMKKGSPVIRENVLHRLSRWFLVTSQKITGKLSISSGVTFFLSLIGWKASEKVGYDLIDIISKYKLHAVVILTVVIIIFTYLQKMAPQLLNYIFKWTDKYDPVKYLLSRAIIPIEAGVNSLHYYFLHINPYFNYAFSLKNHYFIMMDTGPDCFTGQFLWDEGNKKVGVLSLMDGILGGSPDSMAFYPPNEYYAPGQISWLENVLSAIENKQENNGKIFICLHAPPINVAKRPSIPADHNEVLLVREKVNATFGTINHFLSQFFHLCMGRKEKDAAYSGPIVDMVLCGHAHQDIEFRIDSNIRIYHGNYSSKPDAAQTFDSNRPYILQTAACGPAAMEMGFNNPPYYRTIHLDSNGNVTRFGREDGIMPGILSVVKAEFLHSGTKG